MSAPTWIGSPLAAPTRAPVPSSCRSGGVDGRRTPGAGRRGRLRGLSWPGRRHAAVCHRRDRCRAAVRPSGRAARGGGGAARRRSGPAAYAAALLSWHRRHRFCANCGAPTEVVDAGHERHCPRCDAHHFPRTDPGDRARDRPRADRLLLGRSPRWPQGRCSVLAGFVEPGETLEDAVRREVQEESGIELGGVSYVASQPWPFPSSLMLSQAVAESPASPRRTATSWRTCAGSSARRCWRRPRAAAQFGSPPYSISRRLIDGWLAGPAGPQERSGRSG